jgi:hypothetical protein
MKTYIISEKTRNAHFTREFSDQIIPAAALINNKITKPTTSILYPSL